MTELREHEGSSASLRAAIVDAIKQKHPATVGDLANLLTAERVVDEGNLIEAVQALVRDGELKLRTPAYAFESILDYLLTPALAGWFWSTMGLTALSVISVFIAPGLFPLTIARWVFGGVLVIYLPGYSLVEFLFPAQTDLDKVERFTFSVAISLCVDILLGLLLNYLPGSGLRLEPIVGSLSGVTLIFALAAMVRKYRDNVGTIEGTSGS